MGGRKIRNRMRLKPYIETELRKSENKLEIGFEDFPTHDVAICFESRSYLRGKIDAFKWVLNKE